MAFNVIIGKNPQLPGEAFPLGLNMRSASHDQAKLAFGSFGQPIEFRFRKPAIFMALLVGQRGQHEAVFHDRSAFESKGGMG
jgi:hypothetical protein